MSEPAAIRDSDSKTTLYVCGAIRDAAGIHARPGAVAVRDGHIVASSEVDSVQQVVQADNVIELPDTLLLPAMVNVHAHLDLYELGPVPLEGNFIDWVAEHIMPWRAEASEAVLAQSVIWGLRASRDAGVGAIGDIAGSVGAIMGRMVAAQEESLPGVSWVECVGIGEDAQQGIDRVEHVRQTVQRNVDNWPLRFHVDVQPHAPYSADPRLYDLPELCGSTHLAETPEEAAFVQDGSGPIADFRKRIGRWNPAMRGWGMTPVEHFTRVAKRVPWVVAHCNYVTDADITLLARFERDITVAYCPIASEYFGHRDHRYLDMLAAGLNVALGTDSILCQPTDEPQPMGILPQMRRLFRRDGFNRQEVLAMATINGAKALRASGDRWRATLSAGEPARLIGVKFDAADATDPLEQVLLNDEPAKMICLNA